VTEDKVREIPGAVSRSFSGGSGMRKWSCGGIALSFCGTRRDDARVHSGPKVASGSGNANVNINLSSRNLHPQYLQVHQLLVNIPQILSPVSLGIQPYLETSHSYKYLPLFLNTNATCETTWDQFNAGGSSKDVTGIVYSFFFALSHRTSHRKVSHQHK
jgi:hypothetical protein